MKKKVLESLLKQMQEMMSAEHADVPLKEDELSDVMDDAKEEAAESPEEEACEPEDAEEVLPLKKKPLLTVSMSSIKASRPKPKPGIAQIVAALASPKKK